MYRNVDSEVKMLLVALLSSVFVFSAIADNHAPIITPSAEMSEVLIGPNMVYDFCCDASDVDGDDLRYCWYLDDALVRSGGNPSWMFDGTESSLDSVHNVKCVVEDGITETSIEWTVRIVDRFFVDASADSRYQEGCHGNGSEEYPFTSLEYAMDFVGEGSEVVVAPGTYYSVWFSFPVFVTATGGVDRTIIEGGFHYCPETEDSQRPLVQGFKIESSHEDFANVDFYNCLFAGNKYQMNDSPFVDCSFDRCTIAGNCVKPYDPEDEPADLFDGCTFDDCILWDNENCVNDVQDPGFVAARHGDFRLRASSPWVDGEVATKGIIVPISRADYVVSIDCEGCGSCVGFSFCEFGGQDGVSMAWFSPDGRMGHGPDYLLINGSKRINLDGIFAFYLYAPESYSSYYDDYDDYMLVDRDMDIKVVFKRLTFYVDAQNGDDDNWGCDPEMPLKTIQAAIERSYSGDRIVVADGVYAPIESCNRGIVIESKNGYKTTIIDGGGENCCAALGGPEELPQDDEPLPYGTAWMGTNTVLRGFTLRNGYAYSFGGGATAGTLEACLLVSNAVWSTGHMSASPQGCGGGAFWSVLRNCTIVGNKALYAAAEDSSGGYFGGEGGGTCSCKLYNCIEWDNSELIGGGSTYVDCCTNNPGFADAPNGDYRLLPTSPCVSDGVVQAGCEMEIAGGVWNPNADLTADEVEDWLVDELAPNFHRQDESASDYRKRFKTMFGSDYKEALFKPTGKMDRNGNPLQVWQDFVAGTDPTDENSVFTANISVSNGVVYVTWSPDLNQNVNRRLYKIYGAGSLGDEWEYPANAARHHFFKVVVEMPDGETESDVPGPVAAEGESENLDSGEYCVINLSAGASAATFPVTYLSEIPAGGWTDEYKTTKLVLKKISAGADPLGRYTLTKDFYAGVFEVTQKQWELVMGTRPSYFTNEICYATRPVESVVYDMIRGSVAGAGWPESSNVDVDSFIGVIRAKTGVDGFDLPTEAQWEYAARSGTTTDYGNGTDRGKFDQDSNMDVVGRYLYNGGSPFTRSGDVSSGTAKVGSYAPNMWGLYDMHGNVCEWCLDWSDGELNGVNPVGASSGTSRVCRGGCSLNGSGGCTSSSSNRRGPSYVNYYYYYDVGFRLFRNLP